MGIYLYNLGEAAWVLEWTLKAGMFIDQLKILRVRLHSALSIKLAHSP